MSAWIDANLSKPIFSLKYLPNLDEYITIYGMLGNLLKIFALGYTYLPEIKRVFQENKARQIFGKTNISYVLIRTRTEDKKCSFFGKFGVLCFLETSVLRFALSPYYRQICHKSNSYS